MVMAGEEGQDRNRQILARLAGLKEEHLDCSACPPDRSCCVFKGKYAGVFTKESLSSMIDEERLSKMLDDGELVPLERHPGRYFMVNTPCPALSSDYLCTIHEKKAELGLEACMNFPLGYSESHWFSSLGEMLEAVIVDHRCHSVEKDWPKWVGFLECIRAEFGLAIGVRYQSGESIKTDTLNSFESARKDGRIPPQMRYL